MNKEEIEKKRDELAPMENGRAPWLNGWAQCSNLLMPEIEQLRAQLAERDKEIKRQYSVDNHLSIFKKHNEKISVEYAALVHKYAQAQETIADFRAALKEAIYNWEFNNDCQCCGNNLSIYQEIKKLAPNEALQKHPDSTEVKG